MLLLMTLMGCQSQKSLDLEEKPNIIERVLRSDVTLVDVRSVEDFEKSSVKGAINIPLKDLPTQLDLLRDKPNIVLFCNKGRQSSQALEILKKNKINTAVSGKTYHNVNAIISQEAKVKK